ncbi:MAG: hypothetical protein K6G56_08140 [Clostridiales bacterium]|nr:hypothetical protein [Clostridiales bacterium]
MIKKILILLLAALIALSAFGCGSCGGNTPDNKERLVRGTDSPGSDKTKDDRAGTIADQKKFRGFGKDIALLSFDGKLRAKLLLSVIDREELAEFKEDDGSVIFTGFTVSESLAAVGAEGLTKLTFSGEGGDKVTVELSAIDREASVFAIKKGDEVIGLGSKTIVVAAIRYLDGHAEHFPVNSAVWTE